MLKEMSHIPEGLLSASVEELTDVLEGPTLFHLTGDNPKPLFICTLLHGNETTGFYAIQQLLKYYQQQDLPRSLSIFIGNVSAATAGQRHLDTQDDYNRIWPGTHHDDSIEKDMMQTVTNIMRRKKPFASIDIHNNTGKNPHYACINILNPHGLVLASHFSNIGVYFTNPKGVQSSAFADFCPAIVLECGQSGERDSVEHAFDFLKTVVQIDNLGDVEKHPLKLYHTIARVTLPKTVALSSYDSGGDIQLNTELEDRNFQQLEKGMLFAKILSDKQKLLLVSSESEEDVTNEYLENKKGKLLIKKPVTLSMFTTSERAIRQDCVCYFMEELSVG